jgi:hypothetical protein
MAMRCVEREGIRGGIKILIRIGVRNLFTAGKLFLECSLQRRCLLEISIRMNGEP